MYYLIVRKMRIFQDGTDPEFENETKEQRRKGGVYVLLFTVGSIVAFFISVPLIFGFGR